MSTHHPTDPQSVRDTVRAGYAEIAKSGVWLGSNGPQDAPAKDGCCGGGGCCGPTTVDAATLAARIGYAADDLAKLPEGANLGLSCGNPGAIAALQPGEVVLDLGSGAGFDCFLSGPKVGDEGRVIGVDMTPEMLAKARRNLASYRERTGLDNVEFRLGEIEHLPVADESVDVVISNCVLNLSPDKPQVWREIHRVLKPGGRAVISDLALHRPLPAEVRSMVEALVGCVAGAVTVDDTTRFALDAGLRDLELLPHDDYVKSMESWHDPLYQAILAKLPTGTTAADFITSLEVIAFKPKACCGGGCGCGSGSGCCGG